MTYYKNILLIILVVSNFRNYASEEVVLESRCGSGDMCVVTFSQEQLHDSTCFVEIQVRDVLKEWGFSEQVLMNFKNCDQRGQIEGLCLTILDTIAEADKKALFVKTVNDTMMPNVTSGKSLEGIIQRSFNLTSEVKADKPGVITWFMNGLLETVWWSTHQHFEHCFDRALQGDVVALSNVDTITRLSKTQALSEEQKIEFFKKLQRRTMNALAQVNSWASDETIKLNAYDYDDEAAIEEVAKKQKALSLQQEARTRAVYFYSERIALSLFKGLFKNPQTHSLMVTNDRATLAPIINVVRMQSDLVAHAGSLRDERCDLDWLRVHGLEVPQHRESKFVFREHLANLLVEKRKKQQ